MQPTDPDDIDDPDDNDIDDPEITDDVIADLIRAFNTALADLLRKDGPDYLKITRQVVTTGDDPDAT